VECGLCHAKIVFNRMTVQYNHHKLQYRVLLLTGRRNLC